MTDTSRTGPGDASAVPMPTKTELRAVIPDHCFQTDLRTSLAYAAASAATTVVPAVLAWLYIPMTWGWLPVWVLYAAVVGTFGTGAWVIAHECGHGAFSSNKRIQDTVGFIFHSALLVPYFSWQRSHAIHHAKTNNLDDGETHVPPIASGAEGQLNLKLRRALGPVLFPLIAGTLTLLIGWPVYLLTGLSGGWSRGTTNHFWPFRPFDGSLFPDRWVKKVLWSTGGVVAVLGLLVWWAVAAGSITPVLAVYVGPYLVTNAWLVVYTWLQHTADDVPYYRRDSWDYVKGAFATVDRNYGIFDRLHHNIGSTHVAHHLFSRIPHYRAAEATAAIKAAFPEHYRFDPTPIPVALWRIARDCAVVEQRDNGEWYYVVVPVGKR